MVEQVLLVVAGPGHVAVRSQQHGGHLQLVADVDDVVDPVRPSRDGELTGLVEQQPASSVHQLVETTSRQADVAQPLTDQLVAFTEVVVVLLDACHLVAAADLSAECSAPSIRHPDRARRAPGRQSRRNRLSRRYRPPGHDYHLGWTRAGAPRT